MFESRSEDKEVRIRRETKQQTYRDVPAGFDCSCLWQGCTAYYGGPRHFPRVAAAQKILLWTCCIEIYISSSACLPLAVAVCKQNQKISKEIESLATPYKSNVSKKIVARLTVLAEVSFLFLSRFVCRLQKTWAGSFEESARVQRCRGIEVCSTPGEPQHVAWDL